MKLCRVCSAECEDNAELCPVCGAEFLAEDEIDNNDGCEEILLTDPVLAASVEDVVTAEIFKDLLTENKIPFTCDEASMKVVFGGGFVAEDIYVSESNLEEAQRIYDEVLNAEPIFSDEDFEDEE